VRIAIGDALLGQHRLAWRALWKQGRIRAAGRALAGMASYPDRIRDSWRHRLGVVLGAPERAYARCVNTARLMALRARRAPRRLLRIALGREPIVRTRNAAGRPAMAPPLTHVWIDGTALGEGQTGYFSLVSELIRAFAKTPDHVVHVVSARAGRAALMTRLGGDAQAIRFHGAGWRVVHWSEIHRRICARPTSVIPAARLSYPARALRFLWRRLPRPSTRSHGPGTIEVLVWRGRFRWTDSHRIAIVQDLTTRIHPELHTAGNVAEFDEFLGYVQRHAHTVATISAQSRRDIVERIGVCPESVRIFPMPVHPQYTEPCFDRGVVALHDIDEPFVLAVGTIEPRKNLRRLVDAFELLKHDAAAAGVRIVLAGGAGWDDQFRQFLIFSDAGRRVQLLGYVPLEHLPSLYHFAAAVVYPSVYEGFGLPVLEAMCCSSIVAASRISALPEVLGDDGIQFDPYDTEDLARAVLRALSLSPAEATAYRRRSRERAMMHLARLAHEDPLPRRATRVDPHADYSRSLT
jgi:glycosyltransferase involved in cell wall biosynthesis